MFKLHFAETQAIIQHFYLILFDFYLFSDIYNNKRYIFDSRLTETGCLPMT